MLDIYEERTAHACIHKHPRLVAMMWMESATMSESERKCCVTLSAIAVGERAELRHFLRTLLLLLPLAPTLHDTSKSKVKSGFLTLRLDRRRRDRSDHLRDQKRERKRKRMQRADGRTPIATHLPTYLPTIPPPRSYADPREALFLAERYLEMVDLEKINVRVLARGCPCGLMRCDFSETQIKTG